MSDIGLFWTCISLAVLFYFLSIKIMDSSIWVSVVFNLLSAGALFFWIENSEKCFWFLTFQEQHLIRWFLFYLITSAAFGIVAGTAWNNIKMIAGIREDFLSSITCFAIGCIWLLVLIKLILIMLDEHPIICLLTLVGAIPSSHVPTIYVPGEGYVTGHGHHGGGEFTGDNGKEYWYDGDEWHRYR